MTDRPPAAPLPAAPAWVRLRLAQLEAALECELRRRQQLERAVAHGEAALVAARLELAGTRARERQVRHESLHDSLTSLPNRRYFRAHLEHQLAAARAGAPLALLYLDLDAFKPINDAQGHGAGDEVLRIVAARLAHAVRAEDLMSRIGGDEFACVVTNRLGRGQLEEFARKLHATVAAPMAVGGDTLRVLPSIGIAVTPGDGLSADELIRSADTAMFRAKRQRTGIAFGDERARRRSPAGTRRRGPSAPPVAVRSGDAGSAA
jgi:diguanylate cyclase (GGDEF)-like protein